MRLPGTPVRLGAYPAEWIGNPQLAGPGRAALHRFYLPPTLAPLVDDPPEEVVDFVEDDNRSAIRPDPVVTLDGQPFYLSVKGIGSTIDPYSHRRLDPTLAAEMTADPEVRRRLATAPTESTGGIVTGELWLRGSPYGGQGLEHATIALDVSRRADLTDLAGMRIAPVVGVALLPAALEERLRGIHWYRAYRGRFVQEIRLVPSNVRIYFHARATVGHGVAEVFDRFGIGSDARALAFEENFVRSAIAEMTLFARTYAPTDGGRATGLEFHDVWLDKDAVLAPDGTVYFVDLEGIEPVTVERAEVRERVEEQFYRSLYEFMFAFEQIDGERRRRFGGPGSRKRRLEAIAAAALAPDPVVRLRGDGRRTELEVRPRGAEEGLWVAFPWLDP
ncbi:MAG TPA: hypothetical protein VMG36_06135 [Thermoplasmata archaeon]|nr:hypothetical protein [Thermoplasmata archaeon]